MILKMQYQEFYGDVLDIDPLLMHQKILKKPTLMNFIKIVKKL